MKMDDIVIENIFK